MDRSWKRISRSPAIFLLVGLFASGILVAPLTLGGRTFTKKRDSIFDALSDLQRDALTVAQFDMPSSPGAPLHLATDPPKVGSLSELLPGLNTKAATIAMAGVPFSLR